MAEERQRRTVEIVMNGAQPQKTIKGISEDIAVLARNIKSLDPASDAFKQQAGKIRELRKEYKALNGQIFDTATAFQKFKRDAAAIATGTIGGAIVTSIGATISQYISGSVSYLADTSDQLAKIRKATGMSAEEVDKLNASLGKINTRTARSDLRDIAIGLGQIGEPATVAAIENIDKIVVALGDEFQGGAKEITTALGVLRNNLTDFKTQDFAADMLHLGNALNELGAKGLATAPVVTDFATRMSGVLQQFGVSTGQTLGLAAAMQELGISVERGSTAVSKLVQKMAQNPEVFAKVAGAKTKEEVKSFIDLLNRDAISALLKVAQGAKEAGKSNTEFAAIMKELEATGAGVGEVLGKFAQSQDLVREKVDLATQSLTNGNSIGQEFALINETIGAKIEKLNKRIKEFFASDFFNEAITKAINGAILFMNALEKLGGWIQRNAFWIKGLVAAYITYYVAISRAVIIQTAKIALDKLEAFSLNVVVGAIKAAIIAEEILTGKRKLAATAQAALNAVNLLNPYVAVTAAVVGLTVAITSYIDKLKDAKFAADAAFADKKAEQSIKERNEVFKVENESFIKDLKGRNKDQLELDRQALAAAEEIRQQEIRQLKLSLAEKQAVVDQYENVSSLGITAIRNKKTKQLGVSPAEVESKKKIAEAEKKNLDDLMQKQSDYVELRNKIEQRIVQINNEQATSEKELTDKQKQEIEKRKKAIEDFRKSVEDYYQKIEQAKIDLIEEDQARELADLDFNYKIQQQKADAELKALLDSAAKTGASEKEKQKLIEQSAFIKLAIEDKYWKNRQKIIDDNTKDKEKVAYEQQLANLNDYIESNKLAYNKLYAVGEIDKQQYEDTIAAVDLEGKRKLLEIAIKHGFDIRKAEQDYANALIAARADTNERLKREMIQQAEAELRIAQLRFEGAEQKGGPKDKLKATNELHNAEINSLVTKLATEAGITELNEEQILNIKSKYREEFDAIDEHYSEMERDRRINIAQMVVQGISEVANTAFSIRSEQLSQELEAATANYNQETEALEKAKSKQAISDEDYNKKKAILDERYQKKQREIRRKQAINDKAAAIFNIGLSTAQAVMNAIASVPFPANLAFAALAGIMGAVQLGFAASKPIPSFATGGFLPNGPLHRDGGMNVVDNKTGRAVAQIEGGEPVVSRESYSNNREIIDAILNGGGRRIPVFFNPVPSVSIGSITRAQRTVTMAKGGFLPGSKTTTSASSGTDQLSATLQNMNNTMAQLVLTQQNMQKQLDTGIMAVFDYDYYSKRLELINAQKRNANPGT